MSNLLRDFADLAIILFAAVVTTLAAIILAISQVFTKGGRR